MKKPVSIFNFSVANLSSKKAVIHIDGEIVDASTQAMIKAFFGDTTTTSYKSFRNELDKHDVDEYDVIINCPGGHVGDALAMHDLLVDLQSKGKIVNTIGRGVIASAGTFILLAGKQPEMSANSFFMIHDVAGGAYGSVTEMENFVATMRKFNDRLRDFYAEKTGGRKEEVAKLMKAETWFTAEEAKEKGLIAKVTGEVAFTNKIDEDAWQFDDRTILNSYNGSVKPEQSQILDDMKKLFTDWGTNLVNLIKGIKTDDIKDNKTLVNSIADTIGTSITEFAGTLENSQNEAITNYLNSDAGKGVLNGLVNSAVAAAVAAKPVQDAITAHVNTLTGSFVKTADFETELEAIKGGASHAGDKNLNNSKKIELSDASGFQTN